jgi:hypothetical protein
MPTATVSLVPGVNSNRTPSLNIAAYQSTQLIRWDPGSGLVQKIGGWVRFYPFSIGSEVTALHAWEDLSGVLHLGVGATQSLDVITAGALTDITPQLITTNPAVSFSTVSGSTTVEVNDTGSNATIYDRIVLNTPVSVGGVVLSGAYDVSEAISANSYDIVVPVAPTATVTAGGAVPTFTTVSGSSAVTVVLDNHGYSIGSTFPITLLTMVGGLALLGFYTVNSVVDANTFVINAANQANASTTVSMNGGNAQILYYITPGPLALGTGYGIGGYGRGGYGTGVPPPLFVGTPIAAIDYTLDNFGGYLVACPANGPIFVWEPQSGLFNAQMISEAPIANTGIFVSMSAEIIIAYGSSVLGIQDPLLISWCNAGDFTDWTASVTNLAGSFRLSKGSRIIGGLQGPQYALIWTDLDLWSMTFIGAPNVFGFSEMATGCGLIAKFAACVLGTTVFWLSQKSFFALPAGGSVVPVPCTVFDFIFQQLDTTNLESIRACPNSQFGEVTWYFPVIGGTGVNTAFVKFTPQFSAWDFGYLGRSAWIDQSGLGPPIGADSVSNLIFQHETSPDGDGEPISWSFTTGYWALNDGEDYSFVDLVMPDFKYGVLGQSQNASVNISFSYGAYAVGPFYSTPTYVSQSSAPSFLNPRFRGRLASMTVSGSDLGTFVRMGGPRIRSAPDGRMG